MTPEQRKKLLGEKKLSYSQFGRRFRPAASRQAVNQMMNGTGYKQDRLCRGFARLARKPVEVCFPEYY